MFFYVYVLKSKLQEEWYIGYTRNLVRRVKEHNLGLDFATKPYRPWVLLYYEACRDQRDAKCREAYLKTNEGGRFLKRRLKEYLFARRFV